MMLPLTKHQPAENAPRIVLRGILLAYRCAQTAPRECNFKFYLKILSKKMFPFSYSDSSFARRHLLHKTIYSNILVYDEDYDQTSRQYL